MKITPASEGPTTVGSVFDSDAHQFGAQRDRINVTELTPNRRIVYEVTMKDGNTFRHTLEMEPAVNGTHFSKRFQTLNLTLFSKLTRPIGMIVAPRMVVHDVERIKANLERSS